MRLPPDVIVIVKVLLASACGMLLCLGKADAALIVSVEEATTFSQYTDPILVQEGFGEDVNAFNDRFHQWNGATTANSRAQPTIAGLGLVGKDYVLLDNDARAVPTTTPEVKITLSEEAQVFLFFDRRNATTAQWAVDMGFTRIANSGSDGYYIIGYDEHNTAPDPENSDFKGAGKSIEQTGWIYTARLSAGEHTFYGVGVDGNNNYGIVATKAGTVVGGVARLSQDMQTPVLQRLAFGDGAVAFVDRVHVWKVNSTVLNALPGLAGGDFVQLNNDGRGVSKNTPLYEVTLLQDSYAYLLLDHRFYNENEELHQWMLDLGFSDTGYTMGIDEGANGSIDNTVYIYQTILGAGYYQFNGLGFSGGMNQYGLVFGAVPEPSRALLLFSAMMTVFLTGSRRRVIGK